MPTHPLTRLARMFEREEPARPVTVTVPAIEYLAQLDEWLQLTESLEVEPVVTQWAQAIKLTYQLGANVELSIMLGEGITNALAEAPDNETLVSSYLKGHPNR